MIRVSCKEESYLYNAYHMVKAFFPEEEVVSLAEEKASHFARADFPDGSSLVLDACETGEDPGSKREIDRRWYRLLSERTEATLSWGILLGVRPTKLAMQKRMEGWEAGAFLDWFQKEYLVSEEKAKLAWEIAGREAKILEKLDLENGYSLYIGIPFCPTVCSYCSFSSGALSDWQDRVDDYLDALCLELGFLADRSGDKKLDAVYIGGGTPTSLSASQLERLLSFVDERFDRSGLLEYTVEAGRPDTITEEKLLEQIKTFGQMTATRQKQVNIEKRERERQKEWSKVAEGKVGTTRKGESRITAANARKISPKKSTGRVSAISPMKSHNVNKVRSR